MDEQVYKVQNEEQIRNDIEGYLHQHEIKDMLRFLTCGSVDDGKSTLIGRLLYDSHMIYEDQLAAINRDSKIHGTTNDDFDPALLTDGLRAEREQGITIDVAYRYFSTENRKFIIADCPGHEQYTRNMATGASNCNMAVILVDARKGVITQTKRHSFICSLVGVKHALIAVNKMDLVDWSQEVYEQIKSDYKQFSMRLNFSDIRFIPISALKGDNVVRKSPNMPWYKGLTFLDNLEQVNVSSDWNLVDMRYPVQYVLRPNLNFRGFSGTLASGVIRKGDDVLSLPSRKSSRVKSIHGPDGEIDEAFVPMAITVTLEDEIDASRGNMLVPSGNVPHVGNEFEAMVIWMHEDQARQGGGYLIKHTSNTVPGVLTDIRYKVDVNTMRKQQSEDEVGIMGLNEIGRCHITLHRPIVFDPYDKNRITGAFIIIDRVSNITVAAGTIIDKVVSEDREQGEPVSRNIGVSESLVRQSARQDLLGQRGAVVWMTGLSGSGKSTIARRIEKNLVGQGHACYVLDGDNIRHGLSRDLGFSMEDRKENIRRVAAVARLMKDAGLIVISAFISPYEEDRAHARGMIGEDAFVEVHLDVPIDVCEERDPRGLYKKARAGEIEQFTGVSDVYQAPENPDIALSADSLGPEQSADMVVAELKARGILGGE